jgi:hypothetical protein
VPIVPVAGTWQKWLIKAGVEIGGALAGYLLTNFSEGTRDEDVAQTQWMRVVLLWSRTTPAGTTEDQAQCGFDLVNFTGGAPDYTYTAGDFTTISNACGTFMAAYRPYQAASHTAFGIRIYRMAFNPTEWPAKRFADTGPPLYQATFSPTPSTGGSGIYQAACTITKRTPLPKHWGRMYLPGLGSNALDANGRIATTGRDAIRTAAGTLFGTLRTAEFFPVVPVTQVNKAMAFGLLSVSEIAVDDGPDVQRRRRPRQVAQRSVAP